MSGYGAPRQQLLHTSGLVVHTSYFYRSITTRLRQQKRSTIFQADVQVDMNVAGFSFAGIMVFLSICCDYPWKFVVQRSTCLFPVLFLVDLMFFSCLLRVSNTCLYFLDIYFFQIPIIRAQETCCSLWKKKILVVNNFIFRSREVIFVSVYC